MSAVTFLALTLPTLGEEVSRHDTPQRTPWKNADPTSEKVVRWVVEGCAAYPVMAEGFEHAASDIATPVETDLAAQPMRPIDVR